MSREINQGLDKFKYEIAGEVGVPLKSGYNGDLTARQVGLVGGNMVKRMVEAQIKNLNK